MTWSEREHRWVIDLRDGVLCGSRNAGTWVYRTRKAAAAKLKELRDVGQGIDARIVKVEVSYRELSPKAPT